MKIRIRVETEFGWGETRSHDLGTVERDSIGASDEDFGLSLAEGKSLLTEIQRVLLQGQVEEISEVSRACRFCGCQSAYKTDPLSASSIDPACTGEIRA